MSYEDRSNRASIWLSLKITKYYLRILRTDLGARLDFNQKDLAREIGVKSPSIGDRMGHYLPEWFVRQFAVSYLIIALGKMLLPN